MKIHIDIELAQHEVPLAQELLNTLRALTEHVKGEPLRVNVNEVPAGAGAGTGKGPAPMAAPPTPVPVPAPVAAPPPQPIPRDQRVAQLVQQLVDPKALPQVAGEVSAMLSEGTPETLEDVFAGFAATAFNPANIANQQSVAPYMALVCTEPVRGQFKDKFISKLLGHMTKKRPAPVNRNDFYLQCQAFGVLVSEGITQMEGALQTVTKLMKKAEQRAAAMCMLTHTLEQCPDKVAACKPEVVAALLHQLGDIADPAYAQEVAYCRDSLARHAPQPAVPTPTPVPQPRPMAAAAPAAGFSTPAPSFPLSDGPAYPAASGPATTLVLTNSFGSGSGSIFSLSYDASTGNVVAAGKDLDLMVWRGDGTQAARIPVPGMYVCGTDTNPHRSLLAWCGMADPPGPVKTRVALHTTANYTAVAEVQRPEVEMFTCLKFLPEIDGLVVGETLAGGEPGALQEMVAYYDTYRLLQDGRLGGPPTPPLATFRGHTALVTCLATLPGRPGMFATGSRDQTVQLWDVRQKEAAGKMVVRHADMVTGLDCVGHTLLTCSLDQSVVAWDLRAISSTTDPPQNMPLAAAHWDNKGALKVASYGAPSGSLAAVATVSGLFAVDFARSMNTGSGGALVLHAVNGSGQPLTTYNDIKWDTQKGRLFAANGEPGKGRIDVLEVRPIAQPA